MLAIVSNVAPLLASVLYLPLLVLMPIVAGAGVPLPRRQLVVSRHPLRLRRPRERRLPRVPAAGRSSCRSRSAWPIRSSSPRQREFFVDHSRLGRSRFVIALPTWPVYRIYGTAAIAGLAWFVVLAATMAGTALAHWRRRRRPGDDAGASLWSCSSATSSSACSTCRCGPRSRTWCGTTRCSTSTASPAGCASAHMLALYLRQHRDDRRARSVCRAVGAGAPGAAIAPSR